MPAQALSQLQQLYSRHKVTWTWVICMCQTHLVGEELLVDLALVDLLLNGAAGDEAIHSDLLALANAPGTLPGLHVCGGVPVWVIHHHPAEQHSILKIILIMTMMIVVILILTIIITRVTTIITTTTMMMMITVVMVIVIMVIIRMIIKEIITSITIITLSSS